MPEGGSSAMPEPFLRAFFDGMEGNSCKTREEGPFRSLMYFLHTCDKIKQLFVYQ